MIYEARGVERNLLLPPKSICEHLQTHLSLSTSFVLKSLPGWPMLLVLPAVPL